MPMIWDMVFEPHRCHQCGVMKVDIFEAIKHKCDPADWAYKRQEDRVLRALDRCWEAQ